VEPDQDVSDAQCSVRPRLQSNPFTKAKPNSRIAPAPLVAVVIFAMNSNQKTGEGART
jgi:hypothetical protein